jgi:hypothetical protein
MASHSRGFAVRNVITAPIFKEVEKTVLGCTVGETVVSARGRDVWFFQGSQHWHVQLKPDDNITSITAGRWGLEQEPCLIITYGSWVGWLSLQPVLGAAEPTFLYRRNFEPDDVPVVVVRVGCVGAFV